MKLKAALIIMAMLAGTGAATANCYDTLGCDDGDYFKKADLQVGTCEALWQLRNQIYKNNGFCFQTTKARNYFGNQGCYVTSQAAVSLNAYERANVLTIRNVERAKGCN